MLPLTHLTHHTHFFVPVLPTQGSPFNKKDLARACVESSNSIFILTDKLCLETDKQDASTILRAMALKRYVEEDS